MTINVNIMQINSSRYLKLDLDGSEIISPDFQASLMLRIKNLRKRLKTSISKDSLIISVPNPFVAMFMLIS